MKRDELYDLTSNSKWMSEDAIAEAFIEMGKTHSEAKFLARRVASFENCRSTRLNYADTIELLDEYFEECYRYWQPLTTNKSEAIREAICDVRNLTSDPYGSGRLLNNLALEDFLEKKRKFLSFVRKVYKM